jgi:hypothetical protein
MELTPFVDAHSRFNSIDSRPKTLILNETNNNDEHFTIQDNGDIEQKTTRTLSNPIVIDQTFESTETMEELDTLNSSILSKSAPLDTINTNNLRISQSDDHAGNFYSHEGYSPTSSYQR